MTAYRYDLIREPGHAVYARRNGRLCPHHHHHGSVSRLWLWAWLLIVLAAACAALLLVYRP